MIIFSIALSFMNRPATGTIVKHSLEDRPNAAETAKTNTIITGKHFRLTYDSSLDTVSNISQQDSTALEVYRLARSDERGRRILVVTIKPLPQGGMSEESSYKFRHINPDTYREGAETHGDIAFVTFEKADGSEKVAFATFDGKLAMLAYTLQAPGGDLHREMGALLAEFKWNI